MEKSWKNSLVEETMTSRVETVLANNIPDVAHDVVFIIGEDQKKISCHKLCLAIASPVFEAMFSERHSKSDQDQNSGNETMTTIDLPDVDYFGLQNVIQYIYTRKFNVDISTALVTMYAANKYFIPEIIEHCSKMLQSSLCLENVVQVAKAAEDLDQIELKQRAWQFIQQNSDELLDSDEFLDLSKDNLRAFLNFNINGKSELDLFKGMLRWANHQCDQNEIHPTPATIKCLLGDIISLIRFPTMSGDDFIKFVEPSGVLSSEECYLIYKYLSSNELRPAISSGILYSCEKRPRIVDALLSTSLPPGLQQGIQSGDDSVGTGNPKTDKFSITDECDERDYTSVIKLKAVGVALNNAADSFEAVQIKVVIKGTQNCASQSHHDQYQLMTCNYRTHLRNIQHCTTTIDMTTKTTLSKCGEICYIEFDDPIVINPNAKYEVRASLMDEENLEGLKLAEMQTNSILNEVTCTCKAINSKFTVTYTPCGKLIWALRFEY